MNKIHLIIIEDDQHEIEVTKETVSTTTSRENERRASRRGYYYIEQAAKHDREAMVQLGIVIGGLHMNGKKEDDVNVSDLTLRDSKKYGVWGNKGVSIHLDNLSVENSGYHGVAVLYTHGISF